jgi:hypothetical protein
VLKATSIQVSKEREVSETHTEILGRKLEGQSMKALQRAEQAQQAAKTTRFQDPKDAPHVEVSDIFLPDSPNCLSPLSYHKYHPRLIKAYCPAWNPDTRSPRETYQSAHGKTSSGRRNPVYQTTLLFPNTARGCVSTRGSVVGVTRISTTVAVRLTGKVA